MSNLPIPSIDWLMIAPITIVAMAGIVALLIETIAPQKTNKWQWQVPSPALRP